MLIFFEEFVFKKP